VVVEPAATTMQAGMEVMPAVPEATTETGHRLPLEAAPPRVRAVSAGPQVRVGSALVAAVVAGFMEPQL
jgi:hypothetical protein